MCEFNVQSKNKLAFASLLPHYELNMVVFSSTICTASFSLNKNCFSTWRRRRGWRGMVRSLCVLLNAFISLESMETDFILVFWIRTDSFSRFQLLWNAAVDREIFKSYGERSTRKLTNSLRKIYQYLFFDNLSKWMFYHFLHGNAVTTINLLLSWITIAIVAKSRVSIDFQIQHSIHRKVNN